MTGPSDGGGRRKVAQARTRTLRPGSSSALLAVATILVAAACSSGSSAKSLGAPSPTSTTVATSSPTSATDATTTTNPTDAAILATYRGLWTDIATVEGHYPVNPFNPVLHRNAAGTERTHVDGAATILRQRGEYLAGPALDTSRAIVKQLVGTVAVVSDCEYDGSILMNGISNQVVNSAGTQRELVNAEVELIDGVWMVTQFNLVSPGCAVAS